MSGPAYDSEKALETPMTPAFDVRAISHSQSATVVSHNVEASAHSQDPDPEKFGSTSTDSVAVQDDGAFPCGRWKAWSTGTYRAFPHL